MCPVRCLTVCTASRRPPLRARPSADIPAPGFRLGLGPPVGRHPSAGRFGAGRAQALPASRKTAASSNAAIVPIFCCFAFVHCNLPARVRESTWSRAATGTLPVENYGVETGCATSILTVFPGCLVARLGTGCLPVRANGRIARGRMEVPGRRWEMVAAAAIADCRTATAFEGMDHEDSRGGQGRGPPAGRLSFRGRPRLIP